MTSNKRLMKEWGQLQTNPLSYCTFEIPNEDQMYTWRAKINGPDKTPYDKGTFIVEFVFPAQYPFKPPEVKFLTKIYHPSVKTDTGEICNDLINENWSPTLNVKHCVEVLRNMMADPQSDHPLETEIATQLAEKPKEFDKIATKMTKDYAM